ncbi:MAG: adenosylcobinamide-GDP ribazoletransferase, partial [Clostridiales bacterium]
MRSIESLWIALTTYSILPAPRVEWNERNMGFSICFLPVVGIVIGILLWLWYLLCQFLAIGDLLFAAGAIIIPILVSGGIHLDGFADTVDAISSHQSRERKLEILKDSNSGAFAVIYCGVYLVACLGLFSELHQAESVAVLCCGYVLSRAIAALSAIILPN